MLPACDRLPKKGEGWVSVSVAAVFTREGARSYMPGAAMPVGSPAASASGVLPKVLPRLPRPSASRRSAWGARASDVSTACSRQESAVCLHRTMGVHTTRAGRCLKPRLEKVSACQPRMPHPAATHHTPYTPLRCPPLHIRAAESALSFTSMGVHKARTPALPARRTAPG